MAESTVKVVFLGDASKLKREIDGLDGSTSKAESGFGKLGAAIGGAVAVGSVVSLGKGAFDAAIESQKIAAQTEAAIKSTGQAAGITAGEIGDMATALSKKNAVDDEAIQTGQNLLLTFTNIGKADKVFERTTQASIDMAAAMGTDVKSAAMQLGKALNDPTDGLSKLSRAGVQFTDEQKKQIKTMQDAGDMAGAQKVMLAELERQFGGSAAAQATATDRMKIAFGNLQEQVGAKLIPVVERFSAWMVGVGIPAMERFAGWIGDHWPQVQEVIENVMTRVRAVIETVLGAIEAFWRTWGGTITAYLQGLWEGIRQVIEGALRVIQGIINVVMGLIHGDFSRVWDGIRQIFSGAWEAINGLVDLAINEVRTIIETVMRLIAGVFDAAWEGIKSGTSTALGAVVDFFVALPGRIIGGLGDIAGKVWGAISGGWSALEDKIKKPVGDAVASILTWFTNLPGQISGLVTKVGSAAYDVGKGIVDGVKNGISGLIETAGDFAGAIVNALKGIINTQVIDRINSALEVKISLGPLGDISINPPDIPRLARGGITSGPMLALIGDNPSGKEAVIPLDSNGKPPWGSNGGVYLEMNFYAPVSRADASYIGDSVQRTLMGSRLRVALAGA